MNRPLVSVVVITYNSATTVVETLDSIKQQTYKNIELIISDDCSKDDTVELCRKWIESNQGYFVRTNIITVEHNTGTSANCNRGCRDAHGEWIKLIAADDRLLPNCISDYIDYIHDNPDAKIIFSKVIPFGNLEKIKNKETDWAWADDSLLFKRFNKRRMSMLLCFRNPLPAASLFMKSETLWELGGYDESIPLIEDWPLLIRATNEAGIEICFMNKETAEYRFSEASITHGTTNRNFSYSYNKCEKLGRHYLQKRYLFSRIYFFTMSHANDNIFMKCLHGLNIFNPFYHEYNNTLKLFEKTKKQLAQQLIV